MQSSNPLKIGFRQVGERDKVAIQKRQPVIVIFDVQCIAQA